MTRSARRALDGILLLDKRTGLSSNQALQEVRRLFNAEKAGHTGSLDPLASGMLPVCFGQATKLSGLLLESDKVYAASLRLGEQTRTGDAEGEVIARSDASGLALATFQALAPRFLGIQHQIPPMYSALKHQGRRLYELARAGEEVARAPREVFIHRLEFQGLEDGVLHLEVACSKGTYIRTLAEDIASALGQVAHLSALRRLSVAPFQGAMLRTFDQLQGLAAQGLDALDATLLPLRRALAGWPECQPADGELRRFARGQAIELAGAASGADVRVAVLDAAGRVVGIGRPAADGRLQPERWLGGPDFS